MRPRSASHAGLSRNDYASIRGVQNRAVRYTERLVDAKAVASVGRSVTATSTRWQKRSTRCSVNGQSELPTGGQWKCPLVAMKTAHSWPTDLPTWGLVALAMRGRARSNASR